jgi:hypothetical protein
MPLKFGIVRVTAASEAGGAGGTVVAAGVGAAEGDGVGERLTVGGAAGLVVGAATDTGGAALSSLEAPHPVIHSMDSAVTVSRAGRFTIESFLRS